MDWFDTAPRRVLALMSAACVALLGCGLYLQHALVLVALVAGLTAIARGRGALMAGSGLIVALSGFGAFVAARQSWLQWNPPEVASCGRDFYGMIETFPLQRAIPMIFKGSGDCAKIDWTFLGGSIANWSFLAFCFFGVVALVLIVRLARRQPLAPA